MYTAGNKKTSQENCLKGFHRYRFVALCQVLLHIGVV
jgi:hypothetical protein